MALVMIIIGVSNGATFVGTEYPDSLKLYEETWSDYQNAERPFIDVDYFLHKKVITKKDTSVSDDYEPVTYYWLYVQTDDKIANCKVTSEVYNKYEAGDTIGISEMKTVDKSPSQKSAQINQGSNSSSDEPIDVGAFFIIIFIIGLVVVVIVSFIVSIENGY